MTLTEKYLQMIIPYLDNDIEEEIINGLKSYKFACPFCSFYSNSEESRKRKCASLTPVKGSYDYKFICMRSKTPECRRTFGGRSFYNFLAMYNPELFRQYKKELATL